MGLLGENVLLLWEFFPASTCDGKTCLWISSENPYVEMFGTLLWSLFKVNKLT
jgi:hypothetical protein